MRLSELKEKCIRNYKKITAVLCVIIFVIFSNCVISEKIVCRFTTELTIGINNDAITDKDVDNIKGLYFLKTLHIYNGDTNDLSFLENKNHLTDLAIIRQKYDITDTGINNWSYLRNCKKLKNFEVAGQCNFHNLKDFSEMKDLEKLCISSEIEPDPVIESLDGLQDISDSLKSLTLTGIENETNLNLEKFSNLRHLDVEHTSLREIHINTYLEYLNVSDNPYLQTVFLPPEYGTPETIVTNNSPYVNIIYQ